MKTGKQLFLRAVACSLSGLMCCFVAFGQPIPTTKSDFAGTGTQQNINGANTLHRPMVSANVCAGCHGFYDNDGEVEAEIYRPWAASMMGQSARDPIFYACLAIANQDASFAGELCLRCHTPGGWVRGNTDDPTGAGLTDTDFEGVSCSICHRAVDPIFTPDNPPQDFYIFNPPIPDRPSGTDPHTPPVPVPTGIGPQGQTVPLVGNTSLIFDPLDRRRGPFQLTINPHGWLQSTYHREATLCGNCHDVSNPVYSKQPDGSYTANNFNTPHPSMNKYEMFPVERTYSEWLNSTFATEAQYLPLNPDAEEGDWDFGLSRFMGNNPYVSSCQDCHMPPTKATGCDPSFQTPRRNEFPRHVFNGANTWVLRSINSLYDQGETGIEEVTMNESIARAQHMLAMATDLQLTAVSGQLKTRIINQVGHKVPTGYSEGRRMWVNVQFFDSSNQLIEESGAYDGETATLDQTGAKIYEAKLGLDAYAAALSGKPEGEGFHFVLNNKWLFDNRIPPKGFTNAGFEAIQAKPVNYTYADGQHWDDTYYTLPAGAVRAEVRVYHQTTTKEYIEFLRDGNTTNAAGQLAYDQWLLHGKSAPTLMDFETIILPEPRICDSIDFNNDGSIFDPQDIDAFLSVYSEGPCIH